MAQNFTRIKKEDRGNSYAFSVISLSTLYTNRTATRPELSQDNVNLSITNLL